MIINSEKEGKKMIKDIFTYFSPPKTMRDIVSFRKDVALNCHNFIHQKGLCVICCEGFCIECG